MTRDEVEGELKAFIVREFLDGNAKGIDSETPLLEWGVIDSMVMANVLAFIERRFGIEVPPHFITAQHFQSLSTISTMLLSYRRPSERVKVGG
jgi:acyl carrier protein